MRYGVVLVAGVLAVSGCAKLSHLRELLTLKSYSQGQDELAQYVDQRDAQFEQLAAAVQQGGLRGATQQDIHSRFGPPVYQGAAPSGQSWQEEWMYRRQAPFAASAKVYLHFDANQRVVDVIYQPAPDAN